MIYFVCSLKPNILHYTFALHKLKYYTFFILQYSKSLRRLLIGQILKKQAIFSCLSMLTVFPFSFQLLCQDLALRLPSTRGIDTTKRVLATIWLLSNQESYRGVADRFGMNKGTLHAITTMVIKALVSLKRGADYMASP